MTTFYETINITKDDAFVFSMVYYLLGIGIIVLLGIVSLAFTDFSLGKVFTDIRKGSEV